MLHKDCYDVYEQTNGDFFDAISDCTDLKSETDVINDLRREFKLKKALRYLWKHCNADPVKCDSGEGWLMHACEESRLGKKHCEDVVKSVIRKFCDKKSGYNICDLLKPPTTLAPPPAPEKSDDSAPKKKMNLMLIGGVGLIALIIFFGIAGFIFCWISTSKPDPPPPPPKPATVKSAHKKRKKRKREKKKKAKKTSTSSKLKFKNEEEEEESKKKAVPKSKLTTSKMTSESKKSTKVSKVPESITKEPLKTEDKGINSEVNPPQIEDLEAYLKDPATPNKMATGEIV